MKNRLDVTEKDDFSQHIKQRRNDADDLDLFPKPVDHVLERANDELFDDQLGENGQFFKEQFFSMNQIEILIHHRQNQPQSCIEQNLLARHMHFILLMHFFS